MKKKDLWVFMILAVMLGFMASCQLNDSELGSDILPSGDNVNLFYDTIFEIEDYPVTGKPVITSEINFNGGKLMLMGNVQDTIVGSSVATLFTQFNSTSSFVNGPNMVIDTLMLSLKIVDYVGDMDQEITISVHEFTERIYMDTVYKSDYEGTFDPEPLLVKSIVPEDDITLDLLIEDQDFIDKWLALETDTIYFRNDSIFKDYFNGFYISAQAPSADGVMARVHLSNALSRVSLKYANDSTEIDSTAERDYRWTYFTINEFSSQKINVFEHDNTGTYLAEVIDDETANSAYLYVQGMAGVNTRFTFANLDEWISRSPVAINKATLIFNVVPEEESGILYSDLPNRLMLGSILGDDTFEPIYDYLVLLNNDPNRIASAFGGYIKADSKGMFSDTTYIYPFDLSLHFQSMVDEAKTDNDFILQLDDGKINPQISKLWSNLSTNNKRISLEVVYLKL